VGDTDPVLDAIEDFVFGTRAPADSGRRKLLTVVFTDIVDSTARASDAGDRDWAERLDSHDAMVCQQLPLHRGTEINTTGDGFVATFLGPGRAIDAALAIRDDARHLGLEIRGGLHTGEIETRGNDITGMAVNIAARVIAHATAGEILVSRTVADLVAGGGFRFQERGEHVLKGVPGSWVVLAVSDDQPSAGDGAIAQRGDVQPCRSSTNVRTRASNRSCSSTCGL